MPPSVFLCDQRFDRTWKTILPGFVEAYDDGRGGIVCEEMNCGDVLVFHHEPRLIKKVTELAQDKCAWVVVVDLGGGQGLEPNGRVYHRRRSVGKPDDDHFKACFAHFVYRLGETGTPDWQLLEGPPAPDALLAYHMLGLLPDDAVAKRERDRLRPMALAEAETIAAADGKSLKPNTLENREELRTLLQNC